MGEQRPVMNDEERGLVKSEWEQILKGFLSVPIRQRTKAYEKGLAFVETVIRGVNVLAVPVKPGGVHYVPECELCKKPIHVGDNFVFIDQTYKHYDCHMTIDSTKAESGQQPS